MRALLLLFMFLIVACEAQDVELSETEATLVTNLGFDVSLMTGVRARGESFEHLLGTSESFDRVPVDGLALLTKPGHGPDALDDVRETLAGSPYSAYLNDNGFGFREDKLAIIRSADEYDYLAMVRTDGINYDIEHEQVLAKYRSWDQRYDLALVGAGLDWLEADIGTPPEDWMAFAEEVYRFCPDVVEQGTGDVAALAAEMRSANILYLWWD